MDFEIVGEIRDIEIFASGRGIRETARLRKQYGRGMWRKLKGIAIIRLHRGVEFKAEIHWCEATGIGRREYKKILRIVVQYYYAVY